MKRCRLLLGRLLGNLLGLLGNSGSLYPRAVRKPYKIKSFDIPGCPSSSKSLSRGLIASGALIALLSVSCAEATKSTNVSAGEAPDELVEPVEANSEVSNTEITTGKIGAGETGSGAGETGSQNRAIRASTGYKPVKDGFGFENFGGGEAPAARRAHKAPVHGTQVRGGQQLGEGAGASG